MAGAPQYKATLVKGLHERVLELDPAERDAVLERVDAETTATIERAAKTDWLPAEIQASFDLAVHDALGPDFLKELVRGYTSEASEVPVFAPIARGMLNLFGGGMVGALKILPRTWGFVTRNCGRCVVDIKGKNAARISYVDLPSVLRTRGFAVGSEAGILGLMDFVKVEQGKVEVDDNDLESEGAVHYDATWA